MKEEYGKVIDGIFIVKSLTNFEPWTILMTTHPAVFNGHQ
jgi:hypothetical protein